MRSYTVLPALKNGWWRWWESNPRPKNASESFYVRSPLFLVSLPALWKKATNASSQPGPNQARYQASRTL